MTFYFLLIIVRFSDFLDFKHKFNNSFSTNIPWSCLIVRVRRHYPLRTSQAQTIRLHNQINLAPCLNHLLFYPF